MAPQTDTPALPPLIRVVDDNDTLRQSLEFMLQCEGYEVVSYSSAMEFLKSDTPSRPGCLILDIQMPEMSGLDLFDRLNHRGYEVPVIFLTAHGEVDAAVHTMRHGAADFIQKPAEPHKMLERVAAAVTASVELDVREHEVNRLKSLVGKLSPRENDVARCIARGLRNKEIARELGIEETTVKMHRQNALIKLDARSSAELVRIFTILDYETGDDPGSEAAL